MSNSKEMSMETSAAIKLSNADSMQLNKGVMGATDLAVQAAELYPEFLAEIVYRTSSRDALPPRNAADNAANAFLAKAGNASVETLHDKLMRNIMCIEDPKAAQNVCRQLANSAVFMYIAEKNRVDRLEETKAKLGIADDRGTDAMRDIFGAYEGGEERLEIPLPVLATLVDMLYIELAVCYKDASAPSTRRQTRFGQQADIGVLPYATRRNPATGQYVNFHTLEDAVYGLDRMRSMAEELDKRATLAARKARGGVDFGTEPTAQVTEAPAKQEAVWD